MIYKTIQVVYGDKMKIVSSSVNYFYEKLLVKAQLGESYPEQAPKLEDFYKGKIWIHTYQDYVDTPCVLVTPDLQNKEIGYLEHAIYCLTGKRGTCSVISRFDMLAENCPSQFLKYIMRKI